MNEMLMQMITIDSVILLTVMFVMYVRLKRRIRVLEVLANKEVFREVVEAVMEAHGVSLPEKSDAVQEE